MNQISKTLKIFAASSISSSSFISGLPIKTNVIHRNGMSSVSTFGGTSNSMIQLPDNRIETFFDIVKSCEQFRYLDFTKNILSLLTTDIVNLIDDSRPICQIEGFDEAKNQKVNKILEKHGVRSRIRGSIDDIVYYGSISYLSKLEKSVDGSKMLRLYDLENPYSVITRHYKKKVEYMMPGVQNVSIGAENLIYMGSGDFKLQCRPSDYQMLVDPTKSRTFGNSISAKASEAIYYASEPLFYSIVPKVKLYYIKDLLSTILSLKDAIQPTLLTLNQEITRNGSDTTAMNNNAVNLESLINRLSDNAISLSEIMDIDTLINAIFANIRVLPDPGGTLQQLNELNLDSLKDKLNRLKEGIDELKKEILEALGIPPDLWDGSSNSNEVFQKNERLQALVLSKLLVVKNSTRKLIHAILHQVAPDLKISEDAIVLKMFRKSQAEYVRDQKEISSLKDGLSLLSETLVSANEVIESNRFIDKEKYYSYLYEALTNISPDYAKLIKPVDEVQLETEDELDPDKY